MLALWDLKSTVAFYCKLQKYNTEMWHQGEWRYKTDEMRSKGWLKAAIFDTYTLSPRLFFPHHNTIFYSKHLSVKPNPTLHFFQMLRPSVFACLSISVYCVGFTASAEKNFGCTRCEMRLYWSVCLQWCVCDCLWPVWGGEWQRKTSDMITTHYWSVKYKPVTGDFGRPPLFL